ncbi:MAG TPA: hypothetical protein VKI44_43510 [Acetobacteraceae bacterium]|nr:hypothetical protein [Acetobacteraceae bacterium]
MTDQKTNQTAATDKADSATTKPSPEAKSGELSETEVGKVTGGVSISSATGGAGAGKSNPWTLIE